MPTLRAAYPLTWSAVDRARADRCADFVVRAVREARQVRKRDLPSRRWWPLVMTAPSGAEDLLRRAFPCRVEEPGSRILLYVDHVRVIVHFGFHTRQSDCLELTWGVRRWRERLPPAGLSLVEQEVYLGLRSDGVRPSRAERLASALS